METQQTEMQTKSPEQIMWEIKALTDAIIKIRQGYSNPKTTTGFEYAIHLQRLKAKREKLQKLLKPELVWTHPNPKNLPPFDKRTPEEIKEITKMMNDML